MQDHMRKYEIEEHYRNCFPEVPDDCSFLKLQYSAPIDEHCDLSRVKAKLKDLVETYQNDVGAKFNVEIADTEAVDDNYILEVVIKKKSPDGSSQNLKSSELTSLAHYMRGNGLITDAVSKYIRDCASGSKPSETPGTKITAPIIQQNIPPASTAIPTTNQLPLLLSGVSYQSCIPVIGYNRLKLTYFLSEHPLTINNSYKQLTAKINQAIQQLQPRSQGATIGVNIGKLGGAYNARTGFVDGSFDVEFNRTLVSTPQRLQADDMTDIAVTLETEGCLTPQDRLLVCGQISRAKQSRGWSVVP